MSPSKVYGGAQRRLVIAFDVGTTYSGAAYSVLDPNKTPIVLPVTRYPGQENGDFKIPSVLYYTSDGRVRAAGAEAASPEMKLIAEDEGLIYVEWFKLHLRPSFMHGINNEDLPQLPPGKTAVDVFGDFLGYLFACARKYIQESHAGGKILWESLEDRIDFVLSHPNGWEGPQQAKMRGAAIHAGLIPDTESGRSRIHFVTEGEASLHFCLDSGLTSEVKEGSGVMIIDAGGGTVDLSSYTVKSWTPLRVEEVSTPGCILQGSTRINVRARRFLEAKLANSRYKDDIPIMIERFEDSTKPLFKDNKGKAFIHFGLLRDRDPEVGIRSGQLILDGEDVAKLFEPSVEAIIQSVREQLLTPAVIRDVKAAFFVGGFAASPWLYSRLKQSLESTNINLCRPHNNTSKAVAEGAVSFFIDHYVTARVARVTYGSGHVIAFNANDPEHVRRRARGHKKPSGKLVLPDAFSVLLAKGTPIREMEEVSIDLYTEAGSAKALSSMVADVICYRGKNPKPAFMDIEPELFATLCTVTGDTSGVPKIKRQGPSGKFYSQGFKVVLLCGLTEMKAQISWVEKGVEKRGPAKVVYDVEATA